MATNEVEQWLGRQYAEVLRENPQVVSVRQECAEIINGTLQLLEHYNKVAMVMQRKPMRKAASGLL